MKVWGNVRGQVSTLDIAVPAAQSSSMSRPLRIEIEGGWYHVISRGIERREIFRDDSDRRDFLERLFGLTQSHAVVIHGYCLMRNHFHLQLQTVRPNLKEAMQKLLSGYERKR